jgi:hypothetical protein
MLQVLLPLDRGSHVFVALSPHEPFELISLGEPIRYPLPMLPDTPSEITGKTNVNRPIWSIRHDTDPSAAHTAILGAHRRDPITSLDGRVEPGHGALSPRKN